MAKLLSKRPTSKTLKATPRASNAGQGEITAARIRQSIVMRFNPIRQLTPERLGTQLELMVRGYYSPIMRTFDAMERRDDRLSVVAPKAKSSIARHGIEVIPVDDSSEAMDHKEALEYFWNNCSCVDAYEEDNQGKSAKVVRTMANAIGFKFAAHEILWQPSPSGLTAQLRYAPPWFFENITGRLKFLEQDYNYYGVDMDRESWLITSGDGLGIDEACSVMYMFKHMPLSAWVNFCDKFGMPALLGKTGATKGSDQWNAFVEALQNFSNDFAGVCGLQDVIEEIKIARGTGSTPFPELVDKMDKAMTILWRGADLSTQSHGGQGKGQGASLQAGETDNLDSDRAMLLSECLQLQIDKRVCWYVFGADQPLARTVLKTAPKSAVTEDLATLTALVPLGVPFAVNDVLTRLGWTLPREGEELLTPPAVPEKPTEDQDNSRTLPGATQKRKVLDGSREFRQFLEKARGMFAEAASNDLSPLRKALSNVLDASDPNLFVAVNKLHAELSNEAFCRDIIAANASADQLTRILNATLLSQLSTK